MIFKTNIIFDLDTLRSDLEKYIDIFDYRNQLAITYDKDRVPDGTQPHFSAIGRSPLDIDDWKLDYVCPIFHNSYFSKIIKEIPYKMQRVRLMRMSPRSTYSMHIDTYKRLHWAIVTNPSCHLSFQNGLNFYGWHVPANGIGYIVDTTKLHSAVNPWDQYRYHLVIDIKD